MNEHALEAWEERIGGALLCASRTGGVGLCQRVDHAAAKAELLMALVEAGSVDMTPTISVEIEASVAEAERIAAQDGRVSRQAAEGD